MKKKKKQPVAYLKAVVRIPLFAGDDFDDRPKPIHWDWFEYREPGITEHGDIGVCKRRVDVVSCSVERVSR